MRADGFNVLNMTRDLFSITDFAHQFVDETAGQLIRALNMASVEFTRHESSPW